MATPPSSFPCSQEDVLLEALEDYEKKQEAVYDPVSFGDIGTYLQNKRAKLQRQAEAVQAESCLLYTSPSPRDS